MKRFLVFVFFMGFLFAEEAQACSLATAGLFKPTLERWEQHPGPKQTDSTAEGDYWEAVPAPVAKLSKVKRGTAAPGYSCDDAGVIVLEVSLPESSSYDIDEFGVYVRLVSGVLPDEIFPAVPVVGFVENNKSSLHFAWLDGAPKHQRPIEAEVEVFLVTNGLDIGPSTFVKIKAAPGKN